MKLSDFYLALCEFAPIELSKEFVEIENGYDNSGIIVPTKKDISTVLFALDLTCGAVQKAIEIGAELIVTHHPAIYSPIKRLEGALLEAASSGIGVISMHLNMDAAVHGVDYYFAKGLGAHDESVLLNLHGGGYGRMFDVNMTFEEFFNLAKEQFKTENIMCFGDAKRQIKRVASFCGAGLDGESSKLNCDLVVSADARHHDVLSCLESGKCVMNLSHYASENFGFRNIHSEIKKNPKLKNIEFYYFDDKRFN